MKCSLGISNFLEEVSSLTLDFTLQNVWLWVSDHTIAVIWVTEIFFVQFFCVFFPFLPDFFCSINSLLFLSFIVPIFWMKYFFGISNFLEVFPLWLLSSISSHCLLKKAVLSLLAVLWNSAFRWLYLSLYLLLFTPIVSSAICKASSDSHFAFLYFFVFGMVLFTASCVILWTYVHSSSGTLFTRYNSLNLSVTSTVYSQGIWFRSYLIDPGVFPSFFSLSLNSAMTNWWSEPQSALGLVFA